MQLILPEYFESPFITNEGTPSELLKQLFQSLALPLGKDIGEYHALAQKHFIRPQGQQRWQMQPSIYEDQFIRIQDILRDLGLMKAILPKMNTYHTIFIHGGIFLNLRPRLKLLEKLLLKGLQAKNIVIVANQRSLDPIENADSLLKQENSTIPFRKGWKPPTIMPNCETEIAKLIWDQIFSQEIFPFENVQFMTIPNVKDPQSGKFRFANTNDTVEAWLNTNPHPGDYLAISNNPYIFYQHATMRNVLYRKRFLQKKCSFETVGVEASINTSTGLYLDTLARWLDTDLKFLNLLAIK